MGRILIAAAAALACAAPAKSADHYDRKIEKAAMQIVARRIGDIRGGFSYDDKLQAIRQPPDPAGQPDRDRGAPAD